MAYKRRAFASDRWGDLRNRKFHRLLQGDPQLRFVVRTPPGTYDLPAQVLAPHVPAGPGRVIFSIQDHTMKLHGTDVRLDVAPFFVPTPEAAVPPPAAPDPLAPRRSLPESEWHRQSVQRVIDYPHLVVDLNDPVIRVWVDSPISTDGVRLWQRLWSGKHPDVVFEHASGRLTVVEVEPDATAAEGFAQVWGDYVVSLRVDRHTVAPGIHVAGVLAVQRSAAALRDRFHALVEESGVSIVDLG
jgi:hypothetical protein